MQSECTKCKIVKEAGDFFKDKRAANGLYSACKTCHQSYRKSHVGKEVHNNYMRTYLKTSIHQERNAIYQMVRRALRNGRLMKENCKVCGLEKVHAHHEDYSKPLEVVWLCKEHHVIRHLELNSASPNN